MEKDINDSIYDIQIKDENIYYDIEYVKSILKIWETFTVKFIDPV